MKKITLNNAEELAIDDAFRSLERFGKLELLESFKLLESALDRLEKTGFAGITISPFTPDDHKCVIFGFKGKHGPCYETGKGVEYCGAAAAALDDDHHLLIKGEVRPVCEKTFKILTLPVYAHVVKQIETEEDIEENNIFRYDRAEEDIEGLFKHLPDKQVAEERVPLFYPGPFKLLILKDGTIVRRGRKTKVPQTEAANLKKRDRLLKTDWIPVSGTEFFQDKYREKGILWIYEDRPVANKIKKVETDPDLSILGNISKNIGNRLQSMIDQDLDYFLLTGSDPGDRFGCCPSEEVGEANELVDAGVLSSVSQVDHRNSCPVSTYAFRNEIRQEKEGKIKFIQDKEFRNRILNIISGKKNRNLIRLIRWTLLIFIILSLVYGLYNTARKINYSDQDSLYEALAPVEDQKVYVLLFHFHKRCMQCRNMEDYTRDLLENDYNTKKQNRTIEFRLIDMDKPANQEFINQFGFITAAIVIVGYEDTEIDKIRILDNAWTLYNDETEYKRLIRSEIDYFLSGNNE